MPTPLPKRKPAQSNRSQAANVAARAGVWAAVVVGLVLFFFLGHRAVRHLFFSGNPHFVVRDIVVTVAKGALPEERILSGLGVTVGTDNLFALDLGDLRQRLLTDPIIQEVAVRRQVPSTLAVTVYGRTPVAQLLRNGGPLIDDEGIVLPPSDRRETLILPVITGIAGLSSHEPGKVLNVPMVVSALRLLRLRDTIPNGNWYDIDFIQLDEGARELRLLLRARPQLLIGDGCLITVPEDGMEEALKKGIAVIAQRSKAHQPTGGINLTFEKVPATP